MSKNIIFEINIHFKLFLTEIIHLVRKIFRDTHISHPLRMCAYQGVRNIRILENFANELNEWSHSIVLFCLICTLIGSCIDTVLLRKDFRPKCFKFWSLKTFGNFIRVFLWNLQRFSNISRGSKVRNFIKKRLQRRCFPVKFATVLQYFQGDQKGTIGRNRLTSQNFYKIYQSQNLGAPTSDSLLFELWKIDSSYPLSLQRYRAPIMDHAYSLWMHQHSRNKLKLA